MSDQVKMSYVAALTRVKCELTRAACLKAETPPPDLIARAKTKLEAVKAAGDIGFFVLYETRLNEAWKALRAENDSEVDRKVSLTLGAGAPVLPGIKVDKANQEKAIAALTVEAKPEQVATWRYEWFKLVVVKKIRDLGIKETPNNAQLFSTFQKVKAGDKVAAQPIGAAAAAVGAGGAGEGGQAKPFSVVANKQRQEINVVIRNARELRSKASREAMLGLITLAVRRMSDDAVEYRLVKKEFLTALQGALDGPESLGLDMPLTLLAAVGAARTSGPSDHPGAGKISFEVSQDLMQATISGFQKAYYDDPSFKVSMEWVQKELRRCLVVHPVADDIIKSLSDAIAKRDELNGAVACRGTPGTGGKAPFLHPSYKDAQARSTGDLDQDSLDIREMQQRVTVKAGQLVAEIRYGTPQAPGRSVLGQELPPPPNDELIVRVGEGVEQREPGRFFATADGIPTLEADGVSLSKVMVHEGDVNLRTGNIRFDGPVEITGSIDNGAIVEVSGDLIVHGTIRGAEVRVGGSLTVKSGMTTGPTGRVQTSGNMTADFIENSNVICGGNLTVEKALINSQVIVGGTIKVVSKGGVVAGGKLIAKDSLSTSNLGFKRGAVTVLDVGVDWRVARSIDIKKKRLEKLVKRQVDDRQALRELVQKSKAQMTQRHKDMKDEIQERLTRMRGIAERLEESLVKCQASLTYSSMARISVIETLTANVNITLCGQFIAVTDDVINVCILSKRRRGSYIVPLEEIEAEEKTKMAG